MKKVILVFIVISFTNSLQSQSSRWHVGFIGTPDFYSLAPPEGMNHSYEPRIGFTFGLESYYSLNKNLDLGLGAYLTNLKYEVDYAFIFYDQGDPFVPLYEKVNAYYLGMPFIVRVNLLPDKKISISPLLSFNTSFIINSDNETTFGDKSIRETDYLRSVLFSGRLGVSFGYQLTHNIKFKIEPRFGYYFKGFDGFMEDHPMVFQIVVGVEYRIGS